MFNKLETMLMPMAAKVAQNKYLVSIRNGFLVSTPLLIAGSIFLILANFPIPSVKKLLETTVINHSDGSTLAQFLEKPATATFSLMAVFAVIGIGYSYAQQINTSEIFGGVVSLMAWLILMPFDVSGQVEVNGKTVDATLSGIPLGWVGAKGIFLGIFCAFIAVSFYAFIERCGLIIRMPEGVPPMVQKSFEAFIPATFVMALFFFIHLIIGMFGTNAFDIVFKFFQTPLLNLGDTLGAMEIAYVFLHLFWFLGINGSSVVGAIFNPILQTLSLENVEYFKTGIGTGHIISQQFQDMFATFGGAGSTLSLVIAMLFFCKSKRIKDLGGLSILPGFFGINEPLLFGLPIVLNPVLLIPFIFVPMMNILLAYGAMAVGLVPICNGVNVPWTTPIVVSGFLTTNWAGALLQLILLGLGVVVYMPFIKAMDKQFLKEEQQAKNNGSQVLS